MDKFLLCFVTFVLLLQLCEAGKMSPAHWLAGFNMGKRQVSTNSASPETTTITANFGNPSGAADTCVCRLVTPTAYVTITAAYTVTDSNGGTSTITLAQPSGTAAGTVEVLTPVFFVTVTTFYDGTGPSTTTLALPTGTAPGTIQIYTPASYVTFTAPYTVTDSNNAIVTTTLVPPSGTAPGTVEVLTPVSYITITTYSGTVAAMTTTLADPLGTVPGTIEIVMPLSYATVYVIGSSSDTITATLATASGSQPGTVQVIVPATTTTSTLYYTGTDVRTVPVTTLAAQQSDGSPGRIEVLLPNYGVTTVTSGTSGATVTLNSASGTQQGSLQVLIPTPNLDCNNHGIQYAIQSNPYVRGLQRYDPTYSSFAAEAFQTAAPQATGLTNYLGVPFIARDTQGSIYGNPPQYITGTAVNHRGYLFAKISGTFTFDFPLSDDITLLWVGPNTYGPIYSRSNANLEQLYNGGLPISSQTKYTYNVTLTQGQYVPFRVLWANAQYDGDFQFEIYAPDGELITNATAGFVFSPYVVQYSCDGLLAPPYVPWAQEGPGSTGTTTLK